MRIGFIGLGKMGSPMVARLVAGGHEVVVSNRSQGPIDEIMKQGALGAKDKQDLVNQLGDEVVIWLMVPSNVVDSELDALLPLLPKNSVIIDGGNSNFNQTLERHKRLQEAGITMVDVGTSGGILGATAGYCLMIGGDEQVVQKLAPLFETLAQPEGWQHVGPNGSGHYVKMVHNAIEYGMMQSYAEGYRLLKEGYFADINLAKAGAVWQHGSIVDSKLNELCVEALKENPELNGIEGFVAESGEARWALETAQKHNLSMPAISAAFNVRLASQKGEVNFATKLLAAMRNKFGGHALNKNG